MSGLPNGWINTSIGNLIELNPKNICDDELGVGFVPMPLLGKSYLEKISYEPRTWGDVKRGYTHFANDDVLLAKITPCFENGKAGIANNLPNGIGAGSTEYFVCRGIPTILRSKYLLAFFKTDDFVRNGAVQMTGSVGHKRVPKNYVIETEIPLAPLPEQKRIADKLDTVLACVDACRERLNRVALILKRFKQSVINSAMSGNLTDASFKSHRIIALEDFQRILDMRTHVDGRVEATNNHEMVVKNFPVRWQVTTFGAVFDFLDYRGKTPNKATQGKRLVSAKNIKMGFVQDEPIEYISDKDYLAWMTRGFPKFGDIFFVTEGHTMGCVALNDRRDEFALAQRTITLQPKGNFNTKFHFYYMLSDSFQKLVEINATGTAAMGIKASKLRGLPIPFPSLAEQNEIVHRVETLFAFADRLETRLSTARDAADRLTPALLAKAFRGELVPQDPNDEPASLLLQRLAENREAAKAKPARGRISKKEVI